MNEPGTGAGRGRQQWRREQRRIARAHHPDLAPDGGGDAQAYVRIMQDLDLRFGVGPGPVAAVVARATTAGLLRRGLRMSGHVLQAVRARLPRAMPGARRYIDL